MMNERKREKIKEKRFFSIALMIFAVCTSAFAQETLSLEDVRNLVLSNSRALAKINLSIQSSQLTEDAKLFDYLPSISLGASASTSLWGNQSMKESFDAGVNLTINENVVIWNGGRNTVLNQIDNIAAEMTRKEALSEYYSVLDSADQAYYTVLLAQASLASAELSLENSALALSIAEIHRESGMLNIADLLQAQADHESKKASLNQAKRDLSLALTKLKSITRMSEIPNLQAVDFSRYESLIQEFSLLTDDDIQNLYAKLWKILSANNPSFSRAALTLQRSDHNVSLAEKEYFPSVSASLSTGLGYSYQNGFNVSDGRISLSASIPLDFWVTNNNVQNRKIAQQQSVLDYEDTMDSFDLSIQTGILDCISQAETVISSQKALEYAEKHYESVFELYRLSQNSVSELSSASSLVNSNRNQLIRAQYNFLSCLSVIRSLGAFDSDQKVIDFLSETTM
jgi:outer membrane protein